MKPVLSEELIGFLAMAIAGGLIGVVFDFFRSAREVFIKKAVAVHFSDTLFLATAFFMLSFTIYKFDSGRLRVFMILASFLGLIIYFFTVTTLVRGMFSWIFKIFLKIFQFIFKILLTPARFLYKILLIVFKWIYRKSSKIFKRIKRKKPEKRGCLNVGKKIKKQKNNPSRFVGFCRNRVLVGKRCNASANNNRKQRKDRSVETGNNRTGKEDSGA